MKKTSTRWLLFLSFNFSCLVLKCDPWVTLSPPGERLGHDHGHARQGTEKTDKEEGRRCAAACDQKVFGGCCEKVHGPVSKVIPLWYSIETQADAKNKTDFSLSPSLCLSHTHTSCFSQLWPLKLLRCCSLTLIMAHH